ncbi:MAG: ABC transporter permease [Chthoniobacterales bacterium]
METTLHDIRYGLRMLRKDLGFTFVAVVALMLGIASTTVIFSVINGLLLRPLPYPEAERLVAIFAMERATNTVRGAVSPANFLDWAAQSDVFAATAVSRGWQGNLTEGDAPERVRVTTVTASFFQVFTTAPMLGRTLQAADEQPGRSHVVVLSQGLWERRFGGDRNIINREIHFEGQPYIVVGVMPASFSPDDYGELWVPSPFGVPAHPLWPDRDPRPLRDTNYLDAFARLKPGVTVQQAQTQMNAIAARLEKDFPDNNKGEGVTLKTLQEDKVSSIRPALIMLGTAVAFLLLIGCANVANLQLARAAARSREISIRAALGADRSRLVRQLLTESVLLALIGGGLGVLVAAWAVPVLMGMAPPALSAFKEVTLDRWVLAFSLIVSVLTGVLFGLAPAFNASSANPNDSLGEGERGSTAGHTRSRSVLITAEVGLTLVLLIGAGLMIKSFGKLTRVDPGFTPENLLVFDVGLPPATDEARNLAFYQQAVERVQAIPGVVRVGAVSRLPFSGGNSARSFNLPGNDKSYEADIRVSTPDYFRTMNIPLLRGRVFTEQDTKDSVRVCVINETAAQMLFPNDEPIGKFIINFGLEDEKLQVVGVIGNIRHLALETAPRPELYQPLGQGKWPRMFIAVRSVAGSPLALLPAVQSAIWSVDRNVALGSVRTMEDTIARTLLKRKFTMTLLTIFAGIAVALASIGLYGVMSYSVSQRTREIGIRMALGAQRADVLRLVVRQGMLLTLVGVALGLGGSLGLTRLISSLLFGVSATDIGTFGAVSTLLLLIALLACWLPARRASGVDPMVALRTE